jgi:hypothetical protein
MAKFYTSQKKEVVIVDFIRKKKNGNAEKCGETGLSALVTGRSG